MLEGIVEDKIEQIPQETELENDFYWFSFSFIQLFSRPLSVL